MSTARFEAFAASLPSLVAKQAPLRAWDASRFLAWLCTTPLSHGELLAARFLLGVWNASTDWVAEARNDVLSNPEAARRFDVLEAAGVWDAAHLAVLRAWLEHPFFP